MTLTHIANLRKALARVAALVLCLAIASAPGSLLAAEASSQSIGEFEAAANTLVAKIETTTEAYRAAEAAVTDIEGQIATNESRVAELEEKLPLQRSYTAASVKSMYLIQQSSGSLLELILSAEDFNSFLTTVRYLDAIHSRNVEQIRALTSMVDELAQTRAMLQVEHDAAVAKREEALAALEQARAARVELQQHAIAIATSEQVDRDQAIEVAQAAIEAAKTATEDLPAPAQDSTNDPTQPTEQAKPATFTTTSGNEAKIEVPETTSVSTDPIVNNTTSAETADWAARIDEYLKGSPLEGYGSTFAEAAATYGVDPRLSPAIATIESGKGTYCFQDHNAWGWGSSGWDDWESAIYEQVEGLATGYDGTLTLEGAERYCPPNYQEWYSSVASEMDGI